MLCCHRTRSYTAQTWMINEHYNKALLTRQVYISLLRIPILHKVMNMLKKKSLKNQNIFTRLAGAQKRFMKLPV
jgi:hypothetical protein